MNELELKRDNMKKWITIGGLAAGALVAGVFYMLLIQTAVAIVAIGAAAVAGYSIVTLAPVVGLKIANAKYRMLDAEKVSHIKKITSAATENPIETMRNLLIQKNEAVNRFEDSVVQGVTARDTFKAKCEKFAKAYPARAPEFQRQLDNMVVMVERKKTALKEAKQSLREGALKLEEMQAYWDMSKDAQALSKAAGMDTGDMFEKLKSDTACDAVFESMSRAFAELEVAASLDVNEAPQQALQHNPSDVFDIQAIDVTQKVKA